MISSILNLFEDIKNYFISKHCKHIDTIILDEKSSKLNTYPLINIATIYKCKRCKTIFTKYNRLRDDDMLVYEREVKFKELDNDR